MKRILAAGALVVVAAVGCNSARQRPHFSDPGRNPSGATGGGPADTRYLVDATAKMGVNFVAHPKTPLCDMADAVGGPGVCAFDYDGDGDVDLFFTDRAGGQSKLYRNDGGHFADVTSEAGLGHPGDALGCLAFDADSDGDLDLFVTALGADSLYRNDGGHFVDVTAAAGIATTGLSSSATAADIDGDGDLDLFVGRFVDSCPMECSAIPSKCVAETNLLFVNQGGGQFKEESAARGIVEADPTLAAVFFDYDLDGDVDLYVGNDMGGLFPDRFYINDGTGHFVDRAPELGLVGGGSDTMGVALGDYNGDGYTDLVTTDFAGSPTNLMQCTAAQPPCTQLSLPQESTLGVNWAIGFVDFDQDGLVDVFQTAGDVRDPANASELNQLFVNSAQGFVFHEPGPKDALAKAAVHRGAAFADLDGDGDVDIAVGVANGPALILENVSATGHSVTIALDTTSAGAIVTAKFDNKSTVQHAVIGGGYRGSSDPRLHFGVGAATSASITVRWLDGSTATVEAPVDQVTFVARP